MTLKNADPQSPLFFLSYARDDADRYLDQFFEDLVGMIRSRTDRPRNTIGFLDRTGIELGTHWPAELSTALSTCQAFVPLYSPSYFGREYCGKEWAAFRSRLEAMGFATSTPSPLILPVLWFPLGPLFETLPLTIREIQYGHKDLGDTYHREGLQYLLRLKKDEEYQEFLTRFADKVITAVRQHPLSAADPILQIKDISSAFEAETVDVRSSSKVPSLNDVTRLAHEIVYGRSDRDDLLTLVRRICELREPGAQIEQIACDDWGAEYLRVTVRSGDIVRMFPVGTIEREVTLGDLNFFLREIDARYRTGNTGLISYLVYGGEPAPEGLLYTATEKSVRLMSLAEYQGLIDFRTYVQKQTNKLAEDKIYQPRLYVSQRLHHRIGKDEHPFEDALATVNDWLNTHQGRFTLILGDFGTGKTFLLRELARRMGEKKTGLIPVLLQMRSLEKGRTLNELLAQHFVREEMNDFTVPRFRHMLEQGQIALLFDGFDELAVRVTYSKAMEHFDTLLEAAQGAAKVVVTSRRQHFLSEDQVLYGLGEKVATISGQRIGILQAFDRDRIHAFLVNLCGGQGKADARLALIDRVKDLLGLSANPRMLSFIAELPEEDLEKAAEGSGEITAASLYQLLLDRWLGHEHERVHPKGAPPGLTVDDRWNAVTTLALRLWQKTEPFATLDEVSEDTAKVLTALDKASLDPAVATFQVGSGTLLVRDEERFSFLHQSVLEWLVARKAAEELRQGGSPEVLTKRELSLLMADFLIGLAGPEKSLEWALKTLPAETGEIAKKNSLLLFERLGEEVQVQANLAGQDLRGKDLSGQELAGADLSGADLSGARLVKTRLSRANLRQAKLIEADLTGAVLDRADLSEADLSKTRLLGAHLRGASVSGTLLRRAKLLGALDQEFLENCDAYGAAVELPCSLGPLLFQGGRPQELAWSADGEFFATAQGAFVRLWEVDSGHEIRRFQGHKGTVLSLAFSHNGKILASGSEDQSIRLWQVDSGHEIQRFNGHTKPRSIAFSRDDKVVAGALDKLVRLWQIDSGHEVRRLQGHQDWVLSIAFSPDGTTLASGSEDQTIRLWQVDSGRETRRLYGHQDRVLSLAYSLDGKNLASGSDDTSVRLWSIDAGQEIGRFHGHESGVLSVAFSPDGERIASGSQKSVRLWNVGSGQEITKLKGNEGKILDVAFSSDGKRIASGSQESIRLWNVDSGSESRRFQEHEEKVLSVAFSPDGRIFASGSSDNSIVLWNADSGQEIRRFQGHADVVMGVAFSPDGRTLASASSDLSVRLWSLDSGLEIRRFQGHENWVRGVAFSPDGKTLASASYDRSVRLWKVDSGQEIRCFLGHEALILSVAFSPDGKTLASASYDKSVRLWKVDSEQEIRRFQGHEGLVLSVAFSPNGETLASASSDASVRLWAADSGLEIRRFRGHEDLVWSVAFSHNGTVLASGSADTSIRLWNLSSGQEIGRFQGHENGVRSVTFSPDGKTLASGSDDNTVRLWDVATGRCLAILGHLPEGWVAYTPDGRYKYGGVISGSFWHVINLCRFEVGELDDFVPGLRLPDEASFFDLPAKPW